MTFILILFLSSHHFSQYVPFISNENERIDTQFSNEKWCTKLYPSEGMYLYDTISMEDSFAIIQTDILSKPTHGSIYLVYTDTVQVFDPGSYTEYVTVVNRKIPMKVVIRNE